ncbi:MAG: hypothetical protein P8O08_17905 [Paracoccaceae bacterium]|nr:hypothetical protein [Paracoccaceae bacterium]
MQRIWCIFGGLGIALLAGSVSVSYAIAAPVSDTFKSSQPYAHVSGPQTVALSGLRLFAANCFSPFLTGQSAERIFNVLGRRHDFYDLAPFSAVALSPANERAVTQGTDRRCEISFQGSFAAQAAETATAALEAEGLRTAADLPTHFIRTPDTTLLAARRLNPRRVAVVHVGTRVGENGIDTFMSVERLLPEQVEG